MTKFDFKGCEHRTNALWARHQTVVSTWTVHSQRCQRGHIRYSLSSDRQHHTM